VLGLRGRHQVDNAVTTAILLEELDEAGVRAPAAAVERGLAEARWPGRLEDFVLEDRRVLLDAAHNPAGARSLAAYLREVHPAGLPIVFTAMKDKDAAGMLAALAPAATLFVLTEAPNPRSSTANALAEAARAAAPGVPVAVQADPGRALEEGWAAAPSIAVAGSIFLVGDVRAKLEARGGVSLS
jgi:dihydrofolate synthase/folylpolyglutamate synthase